MIKKRAVANTSASGIKRGEKDDAPLRFSFRFFDCADAELCPPTFPEGYTQTLMDRLRSISTWTVKEFTSSRSKAIRSHQIDWEDTSRPDGFPNLNEQFGAYPGWQFSLSANEHGRVHGLLIDDTFYVIWLDCGHNLYA